LSTACCAEGKQACKSGECGEQVARHGKSRDGEAAKVLLEVLDRIGPSVLEGTTFDCDVCPLGNPADACIQPRSIRQQLVEYVHNLEAENCCDETDCSDECGEEVTVPIACGLAGDAPCPPCPVVPYAAPPGSPYATAPAVPGYAPPTPYYAMPYVAYPAAAPQDAAISALRDAAETLERTAAQLERHNLYDSSDLTREMAGHLRHESRRLQRLGNEASGKGPEVETTMHRESGKHCDQEDEANQAWYFGGVRISR
jgi:hypothetical protein